MQKHSVTVRKTAINMINPENFNYKTSILFGIQLVMILSCVKNNKPLDQFYFPQAHKIYVYSANDSIGREYWEIEMLDAQTYRTRIYDGSYQLNQETREKIYSNGINLESSELMRRGQKIGTKITSGFVFPFEEIDSSEVVYYKIEWTLADENGNHVNYELVRNRRFLGYENRNVLGVLKQCAKFRLEERIITDMDGSIELNTVGMEYYADQIGLLYRRRKVTGDLYIEQELLEVLSPEEFLELKN